MLKYFDPHIHMVSRTTDDYQNMAAAGITGVIEPTKVALDVPAAAGSPSALLIEPFARPSAAHPDETATRRLPHAPHSNCCGLKPALPALTPSCGPARRRHASC